MGMFDTIWVPCPSCGEAYPAQTKGGECIGADYKQMDDAPLDAMLDVNRHAPYRCAKCRDVFEVQLGDVPKVRIPYKVISLGKNAKACYER